MFLRDQRGKLSQDQNGQPVPHPGYYWLAYDWHNLLPSCIVCNQPKSMGGKKIGKHNRFPVIGQHAQAPNEVDTERPLLINPASHKEHEHPSKHLVIDVETGLMIPLSERGRMCIEIFGLNVRDQLVKDRKRAIREARFFLKELMEGNISTTIFEDIKATLQGKRSYTMAALAILSPLTKAINGDNSHNIR